MIHFDPGHGFASPVFDAQAVFRRLLDGLSHPGTIADLSRAGLTAPDGLPAAAAAFLLALADHDTPVWLAGGKTTPAARWLAFHTGAPVTGETAEVMFAVIDGGAAEPVLSAFPVGDERYPDRSATILVTCSALEGGDPVVLTGPGIKESVVIAPTGLRPGFWDEVRRNSARYPLGVDLYLVAGTSVVGLPRTTHVEEAG
jgi:alpha-D-ribose 1-methylphosphonate 5-triphosphate synthase subunit PhnH